VFYRLYSKTTEENLVQAWWHIPVIPALGRQRQEDGVFETSLGYNSKTCLKETKKQQQ
jgi:hypothetical protein